MKTLFKTLISVATVSILTGCASSQPNAPTMTKKNDGTVMITAKTKQIDNDNLSAFQENHLEFKNDLKLTLHKASEYTLKNGFTHFVIVNKNTNNMKGFPLNTFKDMEEYCNASYYTKDDLKSKCANFMAYAKAYTKMKILPMKNPPYYLSAFDAESTLKETK